MKKNFAKKLATVLSMALVVASVAPVTASAATAPDLKARRATVYEGHSYSYAAINTTGYTVKWAVAGEGAEYAELSKTSGTKTTLSVDTLGAAEGKNADLTVKAKFYKNGKYVKTKLDNVVIKVSATDVEVVAPEGFNASNVEVGKAYDLNRKLTPANSTSKTYWKVTDAAGNVTTNATIDANGVFTANKTGNYIVTAEVKNAKTSTTIVSKTLAIETKLGVVSAETISATQVLVTFNKVVDEASAETVANYEIGNKTVTAELQADKKSVLLTSTTAIDGTFLYVVNPIKLAADTTVTSPIFTKVETYKDTVAPQYVGIEYPSYYEVKVNFSEPISDIGTLTITQNGAALTLPAPTVSADKKSFTFNLTNAVADKAVSIVFVGTKDEAGNFVNPNPVTVSATKTKSDTTAPAVASVNVLSDTRLTVTFTEKLNATLPVATVSGSAVVFTTTDNITYTGTFAATTGVKNITVNSGYTDLSGNTGATYSCIKQITADTAKPTLANSAIKVFNNKSYLVLTFNEDVTALTGTISGLRENSYVNYNFASTAVTPVAYTKAIGADVDDSKSVMIEITNNTTFPLGKYTVTVSGSIVKDLASTANFNDAVSVTFTKGEITASDKTAPVVNADPVVSLDNTKVTVTFSEPVDYATALDVNNYKVNGASIFSKAIFSENDQTVILTVVPGTISFEGKRLITVTNVKDKAGNVCTSYSYSGLSFKENIAPTVVSAVLTSATTIKVTFSENLTSTSATDFEVYVAGTKVNATTAVTTGVKEVEVTLAAPLTDLSKAAQVKLINAVADASGNPATTGSLTNVQY